MSNIPFEDQTNSYSCRLVKVFTFLKIAQNQFKMLLEMSIVPSIIVPTGRNANILVVMKQLQDPFMLVDVPFILQELVKTTKTDKTRFFFVRKR